MDYLVVMGNVVDKSLDLLSLVVKEEKERTALSMKELNALRDLVKQCYNISKDTVISNIERDIKLVQDFNSLVKKNNDASWALKTNKLAEFLPYAKDLLIDNFEKLLMGELPTNYVITGDHVVVGKDTSNIHGTSKPNFLQVALFTILYTAKSASSILSIVDFKESGIYNMNTSPNVQGVKLPTSLLNQVYEFKDWIYLSHNQLVVFGLGYQFGGSRAEFSEYRNKKFKFEDCSSAVAKWIGMESNLELTTALLHKLYNHQCGSNKNCLEVSKKLNPVSDLESIQEGYVYGFRTEGGGHVGVVTNVDNVQETGCFELLSYARSIPDFEGLIYQEYCYGRHDVQHMLFIYIEPVNHVDL